MLRLTVESSLAQSVKSTMRALTSVSFSYQRLGTVFYDPSLFCRDVLFLCVCVFWRPRRVSQKQLKRSAWPSLQWSGDELIAARGLDNDIQASKDAI